MYQKTVEIQKTQMECKELRSEKTKLLSSLENAKLEIEALGKKLKEANKNPKTPVEVISNIEEGRLKSIEEEVLNMNRKNSQLQQKILEEQLEKGKFKKDSETLQRLKHTYVVISKKDLSEASEEIQKFACEHSAQEILKKYESVSISDKEKK
jgi:chromosome segregation ATPase